MEKTIPATGEISPIIQNYTKGATVTPNDTTAVAFDALYVGGAGNMAVEMAGNGASVTFTGVLAGSILPVGVTKVLATGTTATSIIGLNV